MRLLLTRHGQTDWNVQGRAQGRTDTELNSTGIEQAKRLAEKIKNYNIDIIISSPLKRARKTAEIIASGRGISVICDEDIIERSFGRYEGQQLKHDDFDAIKQSGETGVETDSEFLVRIKRFFERIKKEYKDKTVLIVTHKGTALGMCCYIEGLPIFKENTGKYKIENCSILEYEI